MRLVIAMIVTIFLLVFAVHFVLAAYGIRIPFTYVSLIPLTVATSLRAANQSKARQQQQRTP